MTEQQFSDGLLWVFGVFGWLILLFFAVLAISFITVGEAMNQQVRRSAVEHICTTEVPEKAPMGGSYREQTAQNPGRRNV